MAAMMIKQELRPCIVNKKQKGLCHGIFQLSEIWKPSLMVGGHNGGVEAHPVALVETEEGHMILVNYLDIRFVDSRGKFEEFDFGEIENGE